MRFEKADLSQRFFAALVDVFIAGLLGLVPLLGDLLAVVYMLTRDAIFYVVMTTGDWRGRSFGKRLMGLRVVRTGGGPVDLAVSVKRNLPLVVGSVILMVPLIGKFVGPLVALAFIALEIVAIVTDPRGRRIGDRLGDTTVVRAG